MHTGLLRRFLGAMLLGTLGILSGWSMSRADLVIFKDGYTLQGKIKRETTYFVDPASSVVMNLPKLNGFFMVDDEARRSYFSVRQVQEVPDQNTPAEADAIRLQSPMVPQFSWKVPPWQVVAVTNWDKKWD